MPDTDFTVIRHGQTAENLSGRLQGHTDTELDRLGLLQARCAAERLRGETFDHIFSSDLRRAMLTARIIAEAVGGEAVPLPALREWHLGDLENRLTAELWEKYPQVMNSFKYEGDDLPVPGGESRFEFLKRVADCIDSLAAQYEGKRILLVTHAGALRAIFRRIVGPVGNDSLLPQVSNAGYSRFCRRGDRWQLCCWNDVSHLKDIDVRESVTF